MTERTPPDVFDFDRFVSLPCLSGLRLSPDGSSLVVSVALPHVDGRSNGAFLAEGFLLAVAGG